MGEPARVIPFPVRHDPSGQLVEPWMSKAQLAQHYGVSVRTVERWVAAGCPSRMLGALRKFRLSGVEGWHESRQP